MLSILQPTLRTFRTPFVVGALWIITALLLLPSSDPTTGIDKILDRVDSLSPTHLVALGFAAYIVGAVMLGGIEWFAHWPFASRFWRLINEKAPDCLTKPRGVPDAFSADYLMATAQEQLAKYPSWVQGVGREILASEIALVEIRLASSAPEQHEEYARMRSDAQLQIGSSAPTFLIGLGFVLSVDQVLVGVAIGIATLAVSASLALQGLDRWKMADQRLTSVVYLGLAQTPLFDSFVKEMRRRPMRPSSHGAWQTESDAVRLAQEFLHCRGLEAIQRIAHETANASPPAVGGHAAR